MAIVGDRGFESRSSQAKIYYCGRSWVRVPVESNQNMAIVVDRGFESRSSQAKDNNIGMCCFSSMHALLRSKSKD